MIMLYKCKFCVSCTYVLTNTYMQTNKCVCGERKKFGVSALCGIHNNNSRNVNKQFFFLVFFYSVDLLKQDGAEGERNWCSASHGKMLLASAVCKHSLHLSSVSLYSPLALTWDSFSTSSFFA